MRAIAALLAVARGALLGAADHAFERGDRQALADAGAAIDALIFARLKSNLFDDFAEIFGNFDRARRRRVRPTLPAR